MNFVLLRAILKSTVALFRKERESLLKFLTRTPSISLPAPAAFLANDIASSIKTLENQNQQ